MTNNRFSKKQIYLEEQKAYKHYYKIYILDIFVKTFISTKTHKKLHNLQLGFVNVSLWLTGNNEKIRDNPEISEDNSLFDYD